MTPEQVKELYATGERVCVRKSVYPTYDRWKVIGYPNFDLIFEWKLIHIKHQEILDHVLNGGEVYMTIVIGKYVRDKQTFFIDYSPYNTYEIIKDEPKEKVQCQICGGKHHYYKCPQGTTPKPVERITRSYIDESYAYIKKRLGLSDWEHLEPLYLQSMHYLFDYIEYLKKENDIIKALYVNEKGGSYAELSDRLGYDVSDRE